MSANSLRHPRPLCFHAVAAAVLILSLQGCAYPPPPTVTVTQVPVPARAVAQAPAAAASENGAPQGSASPAQGQSMEQLVGRIALYPDDLVAVILPASTNPLQLVQAERFLEQRKSNPKLEVSAQWDDAVKTLCNYPDVVKMMSQDLDWTTELGEAVVADTGEVLEAVQAFRRRAQSAGNLKSDDKQKVAVEQEVITIAPADPQVIYVPQYNPSTVVVSSPAYYPYAYYPTAYPSYWYPYAPGAALATGIVWGAAMGAIWSGGRYGYSDTNININRSTNIDANRSTTARGAQNTTWNSGKRPGEVRGATGSGTAQARAGDRAAAGERAGDRAGSTARSGDRASGAGAGGAGNRPNTQAAGNSGSGSRGGAGAGAGAGASASTAVPAAAAPSTARAARPDRLRWTAHAAPAVAAAPAPAPVHGQRVPVPVPARVAAGSAAAAAGAAVVAGAAVAADARSFRCLPSRPHPTSRRNCGPSRAAWPWPRHSPRWPWQRNRPLSPPPKPRSTRSPVR
jgi:hypothetical protein